MTNFDRIAASTPLNRQAGSSTSKGTDYNFKTDRMVFDVCPPLAEDDQIRRNISSNPTFIDRSNQVYGRFRVIGLMKKPEGRNSWESRWVCRCACGVITAIKSKHFGDTDRCDACVQVAIMRGEKIGDKQAQWDKSELKWKRA